MSVSRSSRSEVCITVCQKFSDPYLSSFHAQLGFIRFLCEAVIYELWFHFPYQLGKWGILNFVKISYFDIGASSFFLGSYYPVLLGISDEVIMC